ncbi:YdbC family protein [Bacillus atrophaeus]|uniref:YdbC family protein n=1 Tax=Bacillus atrophaeus TaxID=1452 RepID=UPI002DB9AFBD|nr:YdbC family protein [Bacillus atrophaeus]MEC2309336.1 YdbC family protein [Bacillus atrophaeus]
MLIKEMKCEVEAAHKEAFSKAQSRWGELKYINGFIKQAGGWRKNENGMFTAIVIGVWEDQQTYEEFMTNEHDRIYANTKQQGTFRSIQVKLYQEKPPVDIERFLMTSNVQREPGWTIQRQ